MERQSKINIGFVPTKMPLNSEAFFIKIYKYLKKNNIINDVKIPILSVIDKNGNINTKIKNEEQKTFLTIVSVCRDSINSSGTNEF